MWSVRKATIMLIAVILVSIFNSRALYAFRTNIQDVSIVRGYPYDEFAGKGKIDVITSEYIVIDDHKYKVSSDIKYNTPILRQCSRLHFKTKDRVYYVLDRNGNLTSIWMVP